MTSLMNMSLAKMINAGIRSIEQIHQLCFKYYRWQISVRPYVRVFVRPQNVSTISMKFGIQVVLDER